MLVEPCLRTPRAHRVAFATTLPLIAMLIACEHSTSSAVQGARSSASNVASVAVPPPSAGVLATASAAPSDAPIGSSSASATAAASAAPTTDPLHDAPALLDADGKQLGQTETKPTTTSPAYLKRMELLWRAIVANDPSIAEPSFFPVVAYEQVKDIQKPAGDWKNRLIKNFGRDVREYHKKLGSAPDGLRFISVDIDEPRAKWMDRGKEGNKLGYFRVTRSKIRYADASGQEHSLELTSLISWRGEWFVVHLHGFK